MPYVDLDGVQTGFVSGTVPLPAWGQTVNDNSAYLWSVMSGDWAHWDPAWDIILSDGNLLYEAYWWRWGREIRCQASYRIGTTTTFQASDLLVLPVSFATTAPGWVLGQWLATDVSTGYGYSGPVVSRNATTFSLVSQVGSTGFVNATSPFTWAAGDELTLSLAYRSSA